MQPAYTLPDHKLRLYRRDDLPSDAPLVLTFLQAHEADAVAAQLDVPLALLVWDRSDWEAAFSPWAAPRAFKKAPDFSGAAAATLADITALLPPLAQRLSLQPRWCGIVGYSLAGLFAAWSAYHTSPFTRIACVSGSLWFDGWTDFARRQPLQTPPERAYFSLGASEKDSRNPRLAAVESATRATVAHWQAQGIPSHFALNPGGHFDDIAARCAAAIQQLASDS